MANLSLVAALSLIVFSIRCRPAIGAPITESRFDLNLPPIDEIDEYRPLKRSRTSPCLDRTGPALAAATSESNSVCFDFVTGRVRPEFDLNLKGVEENYQELCLFLGKKMDDSELEFLKGLPKKRRSKNGPMGDLITFERNGRRFYISEWVVMRSASSTLVKLVLVVRFYQKLVSVWDDLAAIWANIDPGKRSKFREQYNSVRGIIRCLSHCCDNDLIRFHAGKPNPFSHWRFSCKCSSRYNLKLLLEPDTDLNMRPMEENYQELCRLLGKPENANELSYLKYKPPIPVPVRSPSADPVTIQIDGNDLFISEWSRIISAQNILVKLVLIVRFHRKLDAIWDIDQQQASLRKKRTASRAIFGCIKFCCSSDLIRFCERWGCSFTYWNFSLRSCSGRAELGVRCGFYDEKRGRSIE